MKEVQIYTDGSSLGNPGASGYCGILVYKGVEKIVQGGDALSTNNRMELKAVNEALRLLKEPCKVLLFTDSKYVCDGISKWLPLWVAREFKKVKNPDLWQEYLTLAKPHHIKTIWVKGHSGHIMNERCDTIAKQQAQQFSKG